MSQSRDPERSVKMRAAVKTVRLPRARPTGSIETLHKAKQHFSDAFYRGGDSLMPRSGAIPCPRLRSSDTRKPNWSTAFGADWRAGRNAVYQLAALIIGARLAVADA
jgi:hypothetical protein